MQDISNKYLEPTLNKIDKENKKCSLRRNKINFMLSVSWLVVF